MPSISKPKKITIDPELLARLNAELTECHGTGGIVQFTKDKADTSPDIHLNEQSTTKR